MEPALSLYAAYIKKGFKVGIVDKYFEKFIRNHMHGLRPHAVKQLYAKMQYTACHLAAVKKLLMGDAP